MSTVPSPIPIFIGYDPRERAATNVLIDSLYQHSSVPLAITPLVTVTPQLEAQGLYSRTRDPKQSTASSATFPVQGTSLSVDTAEQLEQARAIV